MRLKIFGLVCVTKRRECLRRKQCGGQGHIAMCSGAVRVCLREGHSTVPYIKLSAPRLSRRSKWSLMAWGRVLSPNSESKSCECPRPEVTDSANHPNSGNKDRCLFFSPFSFFTSVCACALFVFFRCVLCSSYAIIYWSLHHFVVSIMKSQCHSRALVSKPQLKQMHISKVSQSTVVRF